MLRKNNEETVHEKMLMKNLIWLLCMFVKVLIWLVCLFINALIMQIFKLGGIPTIIVFGGIIWIAKILCKKWDECRIVKEYGKSPFKYKESESSAKKYTTTRKLALAGMLLAMHAVLGFLKIPVFSNDNRITLTFAVTAVTGTILGPVSAMLVGGLGDVLGYLLNPGGGAYFPGFTISGMISGLIYGMCLYKKNPKHYLWWTMLAVFLITVFVNIILNTFWLSVMYEKAYQIFATARIIKNFVVYPLHVAVIFVLGVFVNKTGIQKKYK